jgi:hypothetical protein
MYASISFYYVQDSPRDVGRENQKEEVIIILLLPPNVISIAHVRSKTKSSIKRQGKLITKAS